ncbi:MAG TPA: hypothetical protein VFH56_02910 [Acidimicrobiales bacterium]|nr:hypothetical protein [Acidimicrobiales bacterium]
MQYINGHCHNTPHGHAPLRSREYPFLALCLECGDLLWGLLTITEEEDIDELLHQPAQ